MRAVGIVDTGMVPVPAWMELDGSRFPPTALNGTRLKTGDLFISGIFHLTLSDDGGQWVTDIVEGETADKRGLTQ